MSSHCTYASKVWFDVGEACMRGRDQERLVNTWSKIAIGMARVAQALGTSTMPERRPSHGQQDSSR